jgi:hypothetical protein
MGQITSNSASSTLLAADKSKRQINEPANEEESCCPHSGNMRGNHKECMLAATIDSHIDRVTPSTPGINTTNIAVAPAGGIDGGNVGVLPDDTLE